MSFFDDIGKAFASLENTVSTAATDAWRGVSDLATDAWQGASDLATDAWRGTSEVIKSGTGGIIDLDAIINNLDPSYHRKIAEEEARKQELDAMRSRTGIALNAEYDNTRTVPIAFGRVKVGGNLVYRNTLPGKVTLYTSKNEAKQIDSNSAYFEQVFVIGHSGMSIHKIGVNGVYKTITEWNATPDILISTNLSSISSLSSKGIKGTGLLCVYIKIRFVQDLYDSPPNFDFIVNGITIRSLDTGGNTSHPNPVDVIYHYLTNAEYGLSISTNDLDYPSFQEASRICNISSSHSMAIPWFSIEFTFPFYLYRFNGFIDSSKKSISNINPILSHIDAVMPLINGKRGIKIHTKGDATYFIDSNNIIGEVSVNYPTSEDKINRLNANFQDASDNYKTTTVFVENSGEISLSGVIEKTIDLPFVTNHREAKLIAERRFKVQREETKMKVSIVSSPQFIGIKAGDIVSISVDNLLLKNKEMFVKSVKKSATQIDLILLDHQDVNYTVGESNVPSGDLSPTFPSWQPVSSIPGITFNYKANLSSDGTKSLTLQVSWGLIEDDQAQNVYVYFHDGGEWKLGATTVFPNNEVTIPGIKDNTNYRVKISYDTLMGKSSGFYHSNMIHISASNNLNVDKDWAEITNHYGTKPQDKADRTQDAVVTNAYNKISPLVVSKDTRGLWHNTTEVIRELPAYDFIFTPNSGSQSMNNFRIASDETLFNFSINANYSAFVGGSIEILINGFAIASFSFLSDPLSGLSYNKTISWGEIKHQLGLTDTSPSFKFSVKWKTTSPVDIQVSANLRITNS